MQEFTVDTATWHSKTVAGVFINRAIATLEKPVSIEGLETLYVAAAAKTLATVLEELAPKDAALYHLTSLLREEPSDWTFAASDLRARLGAYTSTIKILRALQEQHQREQFTSSHS